MLGLPKWSPESVPAGLPELWTAITPRPKLRSGRVLNQNCSSCRELSNAMSHSTRRRREEVDFGILVVGSQTASLTPGPSFAHNLGYICPNDQCEAIFDIYVSRPFQWLQERLNARCFGPCCWALNIRESQRTPNLQLFQVLGFTPTLGQSGVATIGYLSLFYWWLLLVILLVAISVYSFGAYIFYCWLLVVILLVAIYGYW